MEQDAGTVQVVQTPPPHWVLGPVHARWGVVFGEGVAFTVGRTVHASKALTADELAHELVHVEQQRHAGGPEVWWHLYLNDDDFRLRQEVQAYQAQYAKICARTRSREERFHYLAQMAGLLSGPLYGRMVDRVSAFKLIDPSYAS